LIMGGNQTDDLLIGSAPVMRIVDIADIDYAYSWKNLKRFILFIL